MDRPKTNSREDLRDFVYERCKEELADMERITKESTHLDDGNQAHEEYREPLCIELEKTIHIQLSTGGPGDGFRLRYRCDELVGCHYYWQDWGVYEEYPMHIDDARQVEDFYLFGDPSHILTQ